jgi:putative transposase
VSCFRVIAAEKTSYPISLMCRFLGVSRSGFHAWEQRKPSARTVEDERLTTQIRSMHERSGGSYGARRIHLDLREEGERLGRKRVERLMRRQRPLRPREAAEVPHHLQRPGGARRRGSR